MSKLNIGIIFGGKSSEHEVSLQSAKNIIQAIDRDRFDLSLISIDKQGIWYLSDPAHYLEHENDPKLIQLSTDKKVLTLHPGRRDFLSLDGQALPIIDVIFPIVHGRNGEDGSLQGLLELLNIPYVGSSVLGSSLCMDKDITKRLLQHAGIAVAPYLLASAQDDVDTLFAQAQQQLGLPVFIKPANEGSSVGVGKANTAEEFSQALKEALTYDEKVLIETAIIGREIECAVLGNITAEASVCGEVITQDQFYSYDAKYINNHSKTCIPAEISATAQAEIQDIARRAFKALACFGLARVDVFLTEDQKVLVNEINTLPGFTNISMYPQLWQASGLSYQALISRLIELALQRHQA
ncbi:D-alanine--D-alanine ligase [Acinetobacter larvae]|uniref:D-alanine--D-alanine ligase n=1 Tax=Acinetobacter larvae TaxID=1789224 RepID=A0A1B2M2K6_9GAMM|nr:D-alanine--D-alanine ligase [Acinetobacter larvae]AOA59417.1 D-alanine--D-alanine ligase A [Acinetobacter larvae]